MKLLIENLGSDAPMQANEEILCCVSDDAAEELWIAAKAAAIQDREEGEFFCEWCAYRTTQTDVFRLWAESIGLDAMGRAPMASNLFLRDSVYIK